jgi:hypothetical protein
MRIGARLLVCLLAMVSLAAAADTNEPARLKISGFGWLGNRELKRTILLLQGQKKDAPLYDANFVEDAALILLSKVTDDGYLQPRIEATLTTADGAAKSFEWDARLDTILPRPLEAIKVIFFIRRVPLFF